MGEVQGTLFSPDFNRSVVVEARPERLSSDAGALLIRDLTDRLGLPALAGKHLDDPRDPDRTRHPFVELLRTWAPCGRSTARSPSSWAPAREPGPPEGGRPAGAGPQPRDGNSTMGPSDTPRPAGARWAESQPRIPRGLWERFVARHGAGDHVVDVRLSDGARYRDVAVDGRGVIGGEVVGLWDGARPFEPPLPAERIVAIKERTGLIGHFGLWPWMRVR